MFASDEAGRTLAIGVAVSVFTHIVVAWTLAHYVSRGESRHLELQAYGIAEEAPEILGEFAEPNEGHVGRTIAKSNGVANLPGERAGEVGPDAPGPEGNEGAAESEEDSAEQTERAAADTPEEPEAESAPETPPEPAETSTAERSENEPVPSEAVARAAPSEPSASSPPSPEEPEMTDYSTASQTQRSESPDDGEGSDALPSFPSIGGGGADGAAAEGEGEGTGTRGGVSIALIEEVIRAHRDEILECYTTRRDYISEGRKIVMVGFAIGTDGRVRTIRTVHRTTNINVADCMKDRIAELQFPELDETVSFAKKFTIDSHIDAEWVQPRMPDRED